jgi:glycosyltransferase involved in cell wall biosynthesis
VGGIAEVITAENGLLLAPRDVHALAEAVAQVAQNAHRYHKEQIREAARALYSHDAVRDAFTHIYRQVLASHPKKR